MTEQDLLEEFAAYRQEVANDANANRPRVIVNTVKAISAYCPEASDYDLMNAVAECGLDNLTVAEVDHALIAAGLGDLDGEQQELLGILIERAKTQEAIQ